MCQGTEKEAFISSPQGGDSVSINLRTQPSAHRLPIDFEGGPPSLLGSTAACRSHGSRGSFPKEGDPNKDPEITIILTMGTPKKVPLILGNPQVSISHTSVPLIW